MNSGEDESSPRFIFLRKSASPAVLTFLLTMQKFQDDYVWKKCTFAFYFQLILQYDNLIKQ
jgi:hypothetical protein